jgi:replicative DNA helicase
VSFVRDDQDAERAPQNIDLEMAVLGGIMLEPAESWPLVARILTPDHFYLAGHALMFEAMGRLHAQGVAPSAEAVLDYLRSINRLDSAGGSGVVLGMLNSVPTAANVEHHARRIHDKAIARQLIRACQRAINETQAQIHPVDVLLDRAAGSIAALQSGLISDAAPETAEDLVLSEAQRLAEDYQAGRPPRPWCSTGIAKLDARTGGWLHGRLWTLAARSNNGKTRLLCYMLLAAAARGKTVALVNLDMDRDELAPYIWPVASTLGGVRVESHELYRIGRWDSGSAGLLFDSARAAAAIGGRLLLQHGPHRPSIEQIARIAGELARRGASVIAIDQLECISPWEHGLRDRAAFVEVIEGLKDVARRYDVALVVAHQIKRETGLRPTAEDLAETDQLFRKSNAVVLIHDQQKQLIKAHEGWVLDGEAGRYRAPKPGDNAAEIYAEPSDTRPLELIIAKSRDANTGLCKLWFNFALGVPHDRG